MTTPSARFLAEYPDFVASEALEARLADDYGRLRASGQIYLDYTGAGLAAASQVRAHAELLTTTVLGNPHSGSPTSMATTALVERTRDAVRAWFNAGDEYVVVFTANATGALKLVAESFPFGPQSALLLAADNHNSVNGIREFAAAQGTRVEYTSLTVPDLRLDRADVARRLAGRRGTHPRLFAFPAQSNFSGVRHPLDLVAEAQAEGWRVLLDAAAFVPTSALDLRAVTPDFVAVSFYKMFGYPTGVGCLLARRTALDELRRPWFAGGTVNFATVGGRAHRLAPSEAGFEDGTLNFTDIPAVRLGLEHVASIGLDVIGARVRCLTGWLLAELLALGHANGRPLVRIYGPTTTDQRGGIITMNFYDPDGHLLDYRRVEEMASAQGISLRTGCFCNPGVGEAAEAITEDDIKAAMAEVNDLSLPRFQRFITHRSGKSAGAIRVSFGVASTFEDAWAFRELAASLRDQTNLTIGEVTFDIASCRVIRDGS